jgi:hypothetical protein
VAARHFLRTSFHLTSACGWRRFPSKEVRLCRYLEVAQLMRGPLQTPGEYVRLAALLTVLWCASASSGAAQSSADQVPFAAELNRRADSLSRLDPAVELKAAIASGDWRFLGVTGYVAVAPGVDLRDPMYPKHPEGMRVIEGTSDTPVGEAGERFNTVAGVYAERYNRLLLQRLRKLRKHRSSSRAEAG